PGASVGLTGAIAWRGTSPTLAAGGVAGGSCPRTAAEQPIAIAIAIAGPGRFVTGTLLKSARRVNARPVVAPNEPERVGLRLVLLEMDLLVFVGDPGAEVLGEVPVELARELHPRAGVRIDGGADGAGSPEEGHVRRDTEFDLRADEGNRNVDLPSRRGASHDDRSVRPPDSGGRTQLRPHRG